MYATLTYFTLYSRILVEKENSSKQRRPQVGLRKGKVEEEEEFCICNNFIFYYVYNIHLTYGPEDDSIPDCLYKNKLLNDYIQ